MAYTAARALHLALTVAVIPAGVLQWHRTHQGAGFAAGLAVFLGVVFLSLFAIAFDQSDYPTRAREALVKTGPLVASTAAAVAFHIHDPLAAFAWPFSSLAAALSLTLTITIFLGWKQAANERRTLLFLVGPLALGAWVFAGVVVAPVISDDVSALPERLVNGALCVANAAATTWSWFKMSVFSTYLQQPESQARQAAFSRSWGGAATIAMLLGIALSALALLVH